MVDLIRREDAVWGLCKALCTPGPICPDTLCQEMWDKFKDVRVRQALSSLMDRKLMNEKYM